MAPSQSTDGMVYSGTYSNVPVYELRVGANLVMRRRSDNYINATHILKVADLDKPARTRVLEKEVQLGIHEKVQGGYGKYQGTWIPLDSGVDLAKKYSVFHILQPLFDFVPGPQSPPPAPKHATASSNRTKAPRGAGRISQPAPPVVEPVYDYEEASELPQEDESLENDTVASRSMLDDEDYPMTGGSRKRKRVAVDVDDYGISKEDHDHRLWADSLLDYYVVSGSDPTHHLEYAPPPPPAGIDINKTVDNEGHTALHWAAAMGDVEYVKDLLKRSADIHKGNIRGETPLIKCSIFANCYDKGTYQKMVHLLQDSIMIPDKFGATVLHHVAKSALNSTRTSRARYYLDVLLGKLAELLSKPSLYDFANQRDGEGNTAAHIAARASRRCARTFLAAGIPSDIENSQGETVDKMLHRGEERRARRNHGGGNLIPSSSPVIASSPGPFDSSPMARSRFGDFPLSNSNLSTKASQSFNKSFGNFVSSKVNHFMAMGDEELQEKDLLLSDIQAALNRAQAEFETIQRECEVLEAEPVDNVGALSEDRAQLAKEAGALSEQMQHRFLHQAIREGEAKARQEQEHQQQQNGGGGGGGGNGNANGNNNNNNNGKLPEDDDEIAQRISLARHLNRKQEERKRLTHQLIEAQAQAGMGRVGEQCLRVLEKTLNRPKDEIVSMAEEMLAELEMMKKENAAVAVDGE